MDRVFSCLSHQHDWRLVALAAVICLMSSLTAMGLFQRARATAGRSRLAWLALVSGAAGFGIWATHFIAMLAYEPGLTVKYNLMTTVFSLALACLITGAGQYLVLYSLTSIEALLSGSLVGLGIVAMHYTGMAALQLPGRIVWDPELMAASVVLGIGVASASFYLVWRRNDLPGAVLAGLLFAGAILSMHFIGMGAVTVVFDPTVVMHGIALSPVALSILVGATAALMLCACLIAALFDWRTKDRLARQKLQLDTALENMSQGLCMFDGAGKVVLFNKRYSEITGMAAERLKHATLLEILRRQDTGIEFGSAGRLRSQGAQLHARRGGFRCRGRTTEWTSVSCRRAPHGKWRVGRHVGRHHGMAKGPGSNFPYGAP